jgi:hypothetical protein
MRSHFAENAVAVATFVAVYLLFDNQQHLASSSANQVGFTQTALEGKSNRLGLKEEEKVDDQVDIPKPVRLEKYLPADNVLNSPRQGHLLYLADYVYSEIPPDEKPAETVLNSLKDIPIGTHMEEIKRASEAFGLDFNFMKAVAN